jgi:hypothetical protein
MIKNTKQNIFLKKKSQILVKARCILVGVVMVFFLRYNLFKAHTTPFKGKKYMFFIEKKPSHLPSKHTLKNRLEMRSNPCFQEILFLLKINFF